jgi:hypothetical protein
LTQGIAVIAESKKVELKELTNAKRDKRKNTFIDQQYKHIKMYGRLLLFIQRARG